MWQIISSIGKRLFFRYQNRIVPVTDNDLRSIARECVGDGKRPFSVVLSDARDRIARMGARLDDATDARLVDALDRQLALVRLPEKLEELDRAVKGIGDAFVEPKKR